MDNTEQELLGLLIKEPQLIEDCQLISNFPRPFAVDSYNHIFQDMRNLYAQSGDIPKRELMLKGKERGFDIGLYQVLIQNAGFKPQLNDLISQTYDKLIKRELKNLSHKLYNCDEDTLTPCENYLHDVRSSIDSLESNSMVSTGVTLPEAVKNVIDKAIKLSEGKTDDYIKTGIYAIDRVITGLTRKTMSIIGARPSVGKSAMGLTFMSNMDAGGIHCGFISVEMSEEECAERLMQMRSGVSMDVFKTANADVSQVKRFMSSGDEIAKSERMQIIRTTDRSIGNIRSIARRMKSKDPELSVIFIDYIQKIKGTTGDKRTEVGEVSAILTDLATDLNIHVCCLAQINRTGDECPKMKDLKESGDLEQDASYIMLIHRDLAEQYKGHMDTDVKLFICKNRQGRTGLADIKYNSLTTRFYDDTAQEF